MSEDEYPTAGRAGGDSAGDDDASGKPRVKKKRPGSIKSRDDGSKSVASNEGSQGERGKKRTSSRPPRRKPGDDDAASGSKLAASAKGGIRRKSNDNRDDGGKANLTMISRSGGRGGSHDDNASAATGSSGGNSQRKGGRKMSPASRGSDEGEAFRKKSSAGGHNRSGSAKMDTSSPSLEQDKKAGMDESVWDVPSFAAETSKESTGSANFSSNFGGSSGGFAEFNDAAFVENDDNNAFFGSSGFTKTDKASSAFSDGKEASALFGSQGEFGGQASFTNAPVFGASRRNALDKTPLKDPPKRITEKVSLVKKTVFAQKFACQPVTNPLNGNIIFCTSRDGEMFIQEVDPKRDFVQVLSSPILTPELHRKVITKYSRSAYGIDNVLKLCVGIHRSHGQPRVRVVTAIDLLILDSKHILRAIAVWQWGYGTNHPVSLQFLLSPPSGTDYAYDPESLLAADNCVFIAGQSTKGPCVFMCKPSVRESWSANFLSPSGKIMTMAVNSNPKRSFPYLAVGMADGSLSVWTYAAALKQVAAKKNEPFRRLLYPLCRLEALWVLNSLQPTSFAEDKKHKSDETKDAGMCINLEWLPPQPSFSSLLMLAASFQGGFAVFHVELPHMADPSERGKYYPIPAPSQSTQLPATPQIRPFAAIRYPVNYPDTFITWTDFGPHSNPCLALLLHGRSTDEEPGRVVLGAINMAQYRKGAKPKEALASFRVLATTAWRSKSKAFPLGFLPCNSLNAVMCHVGEGIATLSPSMSSSTFDPVVLSLKHPVFSSPPGLDSSGEVMGTDTISDKEGILHVFSTMQCDLVKNDMEPNLLNWTRPARRHWLCRTVCGDLKETRVEEAKEASQFGDDDELAVGGSSSDIICELDGEELAGLVPFRIVRCRGSSICAVLFRTALGHMQDNLTGFSLDCVSIALIDTNMGSSADTEIIEGRDVAFLPVNGKVVRALVLSRDGGSLSILNHDATGWKHGASCRPILGVQCDDHYVEAQRLFVVSNQSKEGLVIVGKKHADSNSCILCGPLGTKEQITAEDEWMKLLPEVSSPKSQRCFWLEDEEEFLSLICLPYDEGVVQKLAVSTSTRVLLLSIDLSLLSQVKTIVTCGALASLGASAVAFSSSDSKIRYLCCLNGRFASGTLATLPMPKFGYGNHLLLAVRPDRFLYVQWHCGASLTEHKEDPDCFMLPTAVTKPALLLEPLIANAVSEITKQGVATPLLRGIVEKFGRKNASITHGDNEGIGNRGAGITPRVYEILSRYGLKQAASWLLTGGVRFERSTNTKILPPWMPVSAKKEAALNSDAFLHLIANGDQYLAEYIQSPDHNMPSNLPRPADPTPYLCREFSQNALAQGNAADAIKMLDFIGTNSSDSMLLQLSLSLENKAGDNTDLLKALSGYDEAEVSSSAGLPSVNTSLAALAVALKLKGPRGGMNDEQLNRWIRPLAPSLQRGTAFRRARQRLLGENALGKAGGIQIQSQADPLWQTPCSESRHLWNEGPNKEKENLLLLDKVEDWLGRSRPTLLGKAGVAAAEERGEGTLANILDMDKDDEPVDVKSDNESDKKGWEEGVGEGRLDEENLVAYYRFWEGEDEESPWRTEGFSDLSRYENKAILVDQAKRFSLQPTSSSVDEGEQGKVKILYDLVFEDAAGQEPSGLAMAATRGGSIDVGMLHLNEHSSRQRCTLELWYYLPSSSMMSDDITLARRTLGEDADDFSKVCIASDKRSMLWEIVVLKSGELEFRTCAGTVLNSKQAYDDDPDHSIAVDVSERKDIAKFEGWNHLCLRFSSRDADNIADCSVSMFMMGSVVGSIEASMLPPGLTSEDLRDDAKVDNVMQKSHIVFGLGHPASFRFTEIRIWACERSEDDVKMMMREYLDAAEARKKKFRVKIGKNKQKAGKGGGLLSPPKPGGLAPPKGGLLPPKAGGLAPPKGSTPRATALAPPKGSAPARAGLLAPPKAGLLAPPKDRQENPLASEEGNIGEGFGDNVKEESLSPGADFANAFGAFASTGDQGSHSKVNFPGADQGELSSGGQEAINDTVAWGSGVESSEEAQRQSLWDSAMPLSQQVRSSAAAALIRGPPATRHFGGNRGGLPDLRGTDRYGVGGIAICGSEKTIVWRDEEDPPALTYPIGASGAIVSDQLDDEEGSEFLCCFLAKDKRMVVFELNSRTVVVELQMTTKLNFWRFLPPEAGEMTLCFMLITPVGGFHWMPLDDSPRPRQVWKRGSDLQGKKIVSYEEGGTNGKTGNDMMSKVGLICVTDSKGTGTLEAWIVPNCGDSGAVLASSVVQGAAFCLPEKVVEGPFLPYLVSVVKEDESNMKLKISTILEPSNGSVGLGEEIISELLPLDEFESTNLEPPTLAMGHFPDAIVCSLGNIIAVLVRSKGVMVAYEFQDNGLRVIAKEKIGHYVVDSVMRYSAIEGGAEIVMLLSDNENLKDGRIASFYFRASV